MVWNANCTAPGSDYNELLLRRLGGRKGRICVTFEFPRFWRRVGKVLNNEHHDCIRKTWVRSRHHQCYAWCRKLQVVYCLWWWFEREFDAPADSEGREQVRRPLHPSRLRIAPRHPCNLIGPVFSPRSTSSTSRCPIILGGKPIMTFMLFLSRGCLLLAPQLWPMSRTGRSTTAI